MADADIQKGLVGLEKLQVQNLKALVTLLLFFICVWFGGKWKGIGLKASQKSVLH